MAHFDIECFQDDYPEIVRRVASHGIERAPRGRPTRDLGYTTIAVHDVGQPVLPLATGRRVNRTVAALEALQLIGAVSTPDLLLRASARFADFMETDEFDQKSYFYGAYGVRIGTQVDYCVRKLRDDPDTRQAVVTLWDPELDNSPGKRDYPCTVALGFSIVDDRLRLNVLMRSNDAWLGLPYDVFQFTQLQWTVARVLGVPPGCYTHTAWSLHVYDDVLDRVDDLTPPTRLARRYPTGLRASGWSSARRKARSLLSGDVLTTAATSNEEGREDGSIDWYTDALAPVVA